jgi:hypothetical protein
VPFEDAVFLVDNGGNQGHDLRKLRREYGQLPGKLILQDLPSVIEGVSSRDAGVEVTGYSFLDPQLVKAARVYCFRAIFHDWSDDICQKSCVTPCRLWPRTIRAFSSWTLFCPTLKHL